MVHTADSSKWHEDSSTYNTNIVRRIVLNIAPQKHHAGAVKLPARIIDAYHIICLRSQSLSSAAHTNKRALHSLLHSSTRNHCRTARMPTRDQRRTLQADVVCNNGDEKPDVAPPIRAKHKNTLQFSSTDRTQGESRQTLVDAIGGASRCQARCTTGGARRLRARYIDPSPPRTREPGSRVARVPA